MDKSRSSALLRAVESVGSYAALARALGVTKGAVHQWTRVPAERVLAVEAVTGVPRQQLRPDIYPTE